LRFGLNAVAWRNTAIAAGVALLATVVILTSILHTLHLGYPLTIVLLTGFD
jgi:hypothetical protein